MDEWACTERASSEIAAGELAKQIAPRGWLGVDARIRARLRRRRRDVGRCGRLEICARGGELGVDVAGGEQAVVADLDEAARQNVLEESADEFERLEAAHLPAARAKHDLAITDVEEAMVRDGDAVGVLAEIAQERARTSERGLGVDDPLLLVEDVAQARERGAVGERRCAAGEHEIATLVQLGD